MNSVSLAVVQKVTRLVFYGVIWSKFASWQGNYFNVESLSKVPFAPFLLPTPPTASVSVSSPASRTALSSTALPFICRLWYLEAHGSLHEACFVSVLQFPRSHCYPSASRPPPTRSGSEESPRLSKARLASSTYPWILNLGFEPIPCSHLSSFLRSVPMWTALWLPRWTMKLTRMQRQPKYKQQKPIKDGEISRLAAGHGVR